MTIYKNRNFMLHWGSVAISQTGGFFATLALPWLVLSISNNDPLMTSIVVALNSLPYAVFILFGGALTDRFSPLRLLLITRVIFFLVMICLAVLVYMEYTPFWLLASFALALGTLAAFGIPASESLLPSILPESALGAGNAVIIGTTYLAQIFGPLLAGGLLWLGRNLHGASAASVDYVSVSFALGLNAFSTLLALGLMLLIRPNKIACNVKKGNLFQLVWQGLLFCWQDRGIRIVLAYLCLISFFLQGPLATILPILSKVKLGLSEPEYGSLYAMIGIGTLIGAGIAAFLKPNPYTLGKWVLCCDCVSGLCLYLLSNSAQMMTSSVLLLTVGCMSGFIMIAGITWFQQRTPNHLIGRVMSILMFVILGLSPISATLTGFLIQRINIDAVLAIFGVFIMICSSGGLLIPSIRRMGQISYVQS